MKQIKVNPKAKALIFDLDGTLADSMPIHFQAHRSVLLPYGIEFTRELFLSLAGIPALETVKILNEKFGTRMDPQEVSTLKEQEFEDNMYMIKPIIPVAEIVKEYYGKLPMAIGTGGYRRLAQKTLQIIGLEKYFTIMVSGDDITHPKPHPETFLKCAQLMDIDPQYCQVFEDGPLGIEAANRAGMYVTMVTEYL